jgi:hypothetical protein
MVRRISKSDAVQKFNNPTSLDQGVSAGLGRINQVSLLMWAHYQDRLDLSLGLSNVRYSI